MKKKLFTLTFLALTLQADEPSVFGAGDLSSATPYGLTETEKHIVQNRDALQKLKQLSTTHTDEIDSLKNRLEGIESVVEGLSQKSQKNRLSFTSWLATYDVDKAAMQDSIAKAIEQSQKRQEAINLAFQQDVEKLSTVLKELSQVIDTINRSYVSKDELNKVVNDMNDFKELLLDELKKVNKPVVDPLTKMENAQIEKEAYALYKKSAFTKAIEYYEYLIQNHYKPARAHYMLGEIYYKRKNYKKAISYFKESAKRYAKAKYMPTLMLHSALSMKRVGDTQNAEKFLEALIVKYPDSEEAEVAKKELAK